MRFLCAFFLGFLVVGSTHNTQQRRRIVTSLPARPPAEANGELAGGAPPPASADTQGPAAAAPTGPPFALRAPESSNLSEVDQGIAHELQSRYETAAARGAAAWQNAEAVRQSLTARGMAFNVATATAVARLQLYFELAAGALRENDFAEARIHLERAEAETARVLKTTGH
jgi:hypothetical protein